MDLKNHTERLYSSLNLLLDLLNLRFSTFFGFIFSGLQGLKDFSVTAKLIEVVLGVLGKGLLPEVCALDTVIVFEKGGLISDKSMLLCVSLFIILS